MATRRRIKPSARTKAKKPKPKKTAKSGALELPLWTEPPNSKAATTPPDAAVGVSDPSEVLIHRGTYKGSGTGMLLLVLALAIGTVVLLCRIFMPETIHFLVWEFSSSLVVVILGGFAFGVAAAFTLSLSSRRRKMRGIRRLTKK